MAQVENYRRVSDRSVLSVSFCLTVLVEFYKEFSSKLDHIEREEREKDPSIFIL